MHVFRFIQTVMVVMTGIPIISGASIGLSWSPINMIIIFGVLMMILVCELLAAIFPCESGVADHGISECHICGILNHMDQKRFNGGVIQGLLCILHVHNYVPKSLQELRDSSSIRGGVTQVVQLR